jgi:hypothetical protein
MKGSKNRGVEREVKSGESGGGESVPRPSGTTFMHWIYLVSVYNVDTL